MSNASLTITFEEAKALQQLIYRADEVHDLMVVVAQLADDDLERHHQPLRNLLKITAERAEMATMDAEPALGLLDRIAEAEEQLGLTDAAVR